MSGYSPLRVKVCRVSEMRKIDEEAVSRFGVDHLLLMEDAGTAVYQVVSREVGCLGRRVVVVAGTGNNGGDALVAARRLHSCGACVEVYVVGDPGRYPEPARRNYEIVSKLGIPLKLVRSSEDLETLRESLKSCDVVIVGLIGIGLKGEVSGVHRSVIEAVNASSRVVVSVDIPSGICGDSGRVCGVAVRSTYTVTFGLPKIGNVLYPGYYYCGKLYVSRLSYPPELLDSDDIPTELNVPVPLPERVRWGHKGTFGKFLAVAGARYYYGAPYYVAYSFLKAGGGYSRLAAPKSVVPYIAARCSEVVYIPLEETEEGTISVKNLDYLLNLVESLGIDVVAVGSGTSLNSETQELVRNLVERLNRPIIVDGDGITAVASDTGTLKRRRAPTIVTPHLIEFTRLTGLRPRDAEEDPVGVLGRVCRELNSFIVLKGAHSLIGYPDGRVFINMTGNPGMAKAGSGDVLTGTIAAMYGIGLRDPGLATRMGVLVHGLAGDLAAEVLGEDGVTPDDILNHLPKAMKILRESPDAVFRRYMPEFL